MRYRLPPWKSLMALESVVRLGTVTAAAEELGVTHGAVSKQLALLEDWTGAELFTETRRRMVPSVEAERLAATTGRACAMMAEAVEEIVGAAAPTVLEVIAPATFAMRWLIPRLPAFSADAATVAVQVRATHTTEDWLAMPFDVAIRRGGAMPGHLRATPLMGETLALFGAPSLVASCAGTPAEKLRGLPLLAADTRPGELASWLGVAGLPADQAGRRAVSARRFPHFYIALEAALSGLGAVVAPSFLVGDLVARGDLVELCPEIRISGPGYALAVDPSRPGANAAARFAAWLGVVARPVRETLAAA